MRVPRQQKRIIAAAIVLAMTLVPVQGAAADGDRLRSGTILSGVGWPHDHQIGGCEAAPDCRAWLESGCHPALAGRDPSLFTSIEDVAELADGSSLYGVDIRPGNDVGLRLGGASIQLWRQDCVEIRDSRWFSWEPGTCCETMTRKPLLVPASAKWMTVSSAPHNVNINWSLTPPPTPPPATPTPNPSPTPQSSPESEAVTVERTVNLDLRGHLRSVGAVTSDDASCHSDVAVVIQRKGSVGWVEVGSTTTDADGAFALRLLDRSGRYRAIAPEISASERTCLGAISATARHRH